MSLFELQAATETQSERAARLAAASDAAKRNPDDFHGYDRAYAAARDAGFTPDEIRLGAHTRQPIDLSKERL